MIEKTTAYKVGQQFFPTIQDAQRQELISILSGMDTGPDTTLAEHAADTVLAQKDKVMDVLTMAPNSRPKARKANGAVRKSRAAKTPERAVGGNPQTLP